MNTYLLHQLVNNRVVIDIPEGFPELMMTVLRELLRNPPETEFDAYSFIADFCKCMMKAERGEDDLTNLKTKITKSNVKIYLEKLQRSGYTIQELNILARIIQKGWKRYKSITPSLKNSLTDTTKEQSKEVWTTELVTDDLTENIEKDHSITLESTHESVTKKQSAWKKYRESILRYSSSLRHMYTQFESLDEFDYEYDSDDMERVNVVKKSQEDYVPPIPDFIDDSYQSSITNINKKIMFEDENEYEDSII